MPFDAQMFANDVRNAIADMPATVTIDGTDYTVSCDAAARGERLQVEGVYVDLDLIFVALVSDFGTLPSVGDRVTYGARQYRIARVTTCPSGTSIKVDCEGLDK